MINWKDNPQKYYVITWLGTWHTSGHHQHTNPFSKLITFSLESYKNNPKQKIQHKEPENFQTESNSRKSPHLNNQSNVCFTTNILSWLFTLDMHGSHKFKFKINFSKIPKPSNILTHHSRFQALQSMNIDIYAANPFVFLLPLKPPASKSIIFSSTLTSPL